MLEEFGGELCLTCGGLSQLALVRFLSQSANLGELICGGEWNSAKVR